ncbi:META domain-containing protein [Flavobacterium sp.]|uniref:META domain-containing protein n=1 Tax=Flavobacterium sp. TaxID=239 RepID=UPI00122238F8|nr:META domain-containing protein [Flavobacterium sp.]RZJ71182.1 MAG: META domain-containing protein [Flavobacterium sp.]
MKKLLICCLAIAFGCGPKEKEVQKAPTEIGDTTIVPVRDDSDNSLDYIGRYEGPIKGKNSSLELAEDFSYMFTTEVSGKTLEEKGSFKWNAQGDGIVLTNANKQQRKFFVGENFLVMQDANGARLNPSDAGEFVLSKQSETEAAKSDGTPMDALPQQITGIHWKLSEVNSKPVKPSKGQDYFIQLNKDGSFGAFAGCNRMGGKYELKQSKVRLFNIISTMMACPEMKLEDEFKKALETSDNFVANEEVLQFRKGGTNLLKFEAVDLPKP